MGYFRGVAFRGGADLFETDAATLIAIQVWARPPWVI